MIGRGVSHERYRRRPDASRALPLLNTPGRSIRSDFLQAGFYFGMGQ